MKTIPGGKSKVTHPNAKVNDPGKIYGGKGGAKSTTGGMDTGKNATNSMGKWSNKPLSPNADAACKEKY